MLAQIGIFASRIGFPPYGTLLDSGCLATAGYDALGVYWPSGNWTYYGVFADGIGGNFVNYQDDSNGCWFPSGWAISHIVDVNSLNWTNSFSGQSGTWAYLTNYTDTYSNGYGGQYDNSNFIQAMYGDIIDSYYDSTSGITYYVAYDGNTGYFEYSV